MLDLGLGVEQDPQSKHYFLTYGGQRIKTSRGYEPFEWEDNTYDSPELFGKTVSAVADTPSLSPILMLRIGRALTFEQTGWVMDYWFNRWDSRRVDVLFSKKHKIPVIFLCPECCEEPFASSWALLLQDLKALGYQLSEKEGPTTHAFASLCGTSEALVVCDCCFGLFKGSTHLYVEQQRS